MVWYEFWRRNTDDPLMKLFLEKYKLHLLPLPLDDMLIGDVCIHDGKNIVTRSPISDFLEKPYQIPPQGIIKMTDVSGIISKAVSLDIGLGLLEGFLNAFGIGSLSHKISATFRINGVYSIKFRFQNAIRNSINVVRIANDLMKNSLNISEIHPLYNEKNRYYLITAAARAPSLSIVTQDSKLKNINVDVNVTEIVDIAPNLSIENSTKGELTFNGKDSFAFGVELHELSFDLDKKKFRINAVRKYVGVRGVSSNVREPSFIGDREQGHVFLAII